MQTRDYKDLFRLTSSMIGTGGELSANEQTQVSNFINRRFQQAFDESPVWPRYFVPSEKKSLALYELSGATADTTSTLVNQNFVFLGLAGTPTVATVDTKVYRGATTVDTLIYKNTSNAWVVATNVTNYISTSSKKVLFDDAGVVQFTEADTVKNDAIENVTTWTPRGGSPPPLQVVTKSLIPFILDGTPIGEFNRIHRNRAFINDSSLEYDFFVDSNGANLLNISNSNDTSAFVSYKKQFTPFTVTSDFYNSTEEVPAEFFNYIAHAVYADFLRVQNRQQEALAEEQVAQTYLTLELEKIDIRSNNNTINKRFSTYVNRQSR